MSEESLFFSSFSFFPRVPTHFQSLYFFFLSPYLFPLSFLDLALAAASLARSLSLSHALEA